MASRDRKYYSAVLSAQGATGFSSPIDVKDFRNAVITFATSGTATLTAKVQGSVGDTAATFSSAASISNPWDYVQIVDLENGAAIDGDTGVVYTGTDAVKQVEINVNSLDYINLQVSAYTQGALTCNIVLTTNE